MIKETADRKTKHSSFRVKKKKNFPESFPYRAGLAAGPGLLF